MSARAEIGSSRRAFLRASAATVLAASVASKAGPATRPAERPQLCLFSKPLHGRPWADLPGLLEQAKIDALDLTCRPGGHVLPERAADDLPRAVEHLRGRGIAVPMITTGITEADATAETILRTATGLGINFAKLGYLRYRDLLHIQQTLADARARLRELADLATRCGIRLGYHNHSGMNVGAAQWDLHDLLRDIAPSAIGAYYDAAHGTIEGGLAGWQIGMHLLSPHVVMLAVKDFVWRKDGRRWREDWRPLGEGMVRWPEVWKHFRERGFAGPVSLHLEYRSPVAPNSPAEQETLAAIARDAETLIKMMSSE